jgi:tetratricopeptide (TPR) repeat protein
MLMMRAAVLTLAFLLAGSIHAQSGPQDQLLGQAILEQQQGDLVSAIRDYRQVLASHPSLVTARVNLGAALAQSGDVDAAIEQYQAALKLAPRLDSIHLNLGLAYARKGDLRSALAQYEIAHRADPRDVRVAILLGDAEARSGRAADAVTMLAPMKSANSENADFNYSLGESLMGAGHAREGAELVEQSASHNNDADAWMLAGSTWLNLNEFEKARRDLDTAASLNPSLPRVLTLDGIARDKSGDPKAAETVFREALKRNPKDFDANLYLGAILYQDRRMEESRTYLDKALELNPQSSMARYESAMWKSTSGQMEAAAAELEKLEAADPQWMEPHVELAALYYRLHRRADGARERQIVEELRATDQKEGPRK